MAGWHHQLSGHEFEETKGDSEDKEAWRAAAHGVAKSRTRLSNRTSGTLLAVHWTLLVAHCLRTSSSTAGNVGSIPGQGTKIPHVWDPTVWPTKKKMKLEIRSRRQPVGPASGCHGGCLPFSLYPTLETVEPLRALYSSQDSEGLPVWGRGKARERYPCVRLEVVEGGWEGFLEEEV